MMPQMDAIRKRNGEATPERPEGGEQLCNVQMKVSLPQLFPSIRTKLGNHLNSPSVCSPGPALPHSPVVTSSLIPFVSSPLPPNPPDQRRLCFGVRTDGGGLRNKRGNAWVEANGGREPPVPHKECYSRPTITNAMSVKQPVGERLTQGEQEDKSPKEK